MARTSGSLFEHIVVSSLLPCWTNLLLDLISRRILHPFAYKAAAATARDSSGVTCCLIFLTRTVFHTYALPRKAP